MAKKTSKKLPKPDKGQLALFKGVESVAPEGEDSEIREKATTAMVRADERAILAEARGEMAPEWVYQYTEGTKTVTGISYPGFRQMFRLMSPKSPLPSWKKYPEVVLVADDPRGPTLVAYGEIIHPRYAKLSYPAFAEEPLMKRRKDGGQYPNFHARAVVIGKLVRNAIKGITDEKLAARFLENALETKERVEHLAAGSGQEKDVSPVKVAKINLLFSMAKGYGLDINKKENRQKFSEFIARQFKIRLSAMSPDQVDKVVEWLRESVEKHGKDTFVGAVDHVTITAN